MRFKVLLILFIVFSCKKKHDYSVDIIGHAGNGLSISNSIYHANSLQAIELALGTPGVEGVEIDLQLSKDNDLWLYHDMTLDDETNLTGCVSNLNNEILSTAFYKSLHKEKLMQFKNLNFSLYAGKTFYLDIRHYNTCENSFIDINKMISALSVEISKWNQVKFIILTNHYDWLSPLTTAGLKVYYEIENVSDFLNAKANNIIVDGVISRSTNLSKEEISSIQSENKKVILFNMRAPKPIREAMNKFPDGLIVDDLKVALIEKSK